MEASVFSPLTCELKQDFDDQLTKKHDDVIPVTFHIENKWDGIVLEVKGNSVFSRMTEVGTNDEYEFEFSINDVEEDDHSLVQEGALFNFYVGYSLLGKTRSNAKMIKFRRQSTSKHLLDSILDKMKALNIADIIEVH